MSSFQVPLLEYPFPADQLAKGLWVEAMSENSSRCGYRLEFNRRDYIYSDVSKFRIGIRQRDGPSRGYLLGHRVNIPANERSHTGIEVL